MTVVIVVNAGIKFHRRESLVMVIRTRQSDTQLRRARLASVQMSLSWPMRPVHAEAKRRSGLAADGFLAHPPPGPSQWLLLVWTKAHSPGLWGAGLACSAPGGFSPNRHGIWGFFSTMHNEISRFRHGQL